MMEWISNWLQNIILIILLATFVDLLLPNSSMQKYAKMVLGLLVMVSIMSPVLNIFTEQLSITNLISHLDEQVLVQQTIVEPEYDESDSEYTQINYQNKMLEQVDQSMKDHAKQLIEKRLEVSVTDVKLKAHIEEQVWIIDEVGIWIQALRQEKKENNNKTPIKTIENVKAVNIDIRNNSNKKQSYKVDVKEQKLAEEAKKIVANEWGILEEHVIVEFLSNE